MEGFVKVETGRLDVGLAKLGQLEALIVAFGGPGLDVFLGMSSRMQEDISLLAADLANDARRSLTPSEWV